MRFVSNANSRMSKPVMHISVSFDAKEHISEEQRQQAVQSVLKEMGVNAQDHQYLIVKHNDTANPHYHIVLNKVDLDGKKLNLGFDGKKEGFIKNRLQVISDKIEQEQGLQRTEGRNIIYDANNEKGYRFLTADEKEEREERKTINKKTVLNKNPNIKSLQSSVQVSIQSILQDRNITNIKQFKAMVESKGIDVRLTENKNGILGISFSTDKISVKGSLIGAKWGDVEKTLITNYIYNKEDELKAYIEVNTQKHSLSSSLVDQAIREYIKEVKPNQNVWQTWQTNPKHEQLYNNLEQYAENIIKEQKIDAAINKKKLEDENRNQEHGRSGIKRR